MNPFDGLGIDVAGLGDINGDGFGDFVIGSVDQSNSSLRDGVTRSFAFVVFGNDDGQNIDVGMIDEGAQGGFRVTGSNNAAYSYYDPIDFAGATVSSVGDVNGDGLNDIAIAAPGADFSYPGDEGAIYIVFGGTDIADVNVLDIQDGSSDRGFFIQADASFGGGGPTFGIAQEVASVGDLNGDGLDDLVFSSLDRPIATIVFGQEGTNSINAGDIATDSSLGFEVTGISVGGGQSLNVSSAGDFNGDGFADLLIGSPRLYDERGAFVLFGGETINNIDASEIRNGTVNGFAIVDNGADADVISVGSAVSAIGDVNGDGFDDIAVGASGLTERYYNYSTYYDEFPNNAGGAFVIFGNDSGSTAEVDVATLATSGGTPVTFDSTGTDGNDVIDGFLQSEVLFGGLGDDTISGNGGSDVINGGAGDDTIILNSDNVAELFTGATDGILASVNGGTGDDTLVLDGSGIMLDFTNLNSGRVDSIENIDITGDGDNTLTLDANDLFDLSETTNELIIFGDSGDTVNASGSFTDTGTDQMIDGQLFDVFIDGNATLIIDQDITTTII